MCTIQTEMAGHKGSESCWLQEGALGIPLEFFGCGADLTNSVVMKATVFPEWNTDWLVPWYHYVVSLSFPQWSR